MMRKVTIIVAVMLLSLTAFAQKPVYLDVNQPLEKRVQDALGRMTTHEKILMIHAQSKFTSAGVPRLGIRQLEMSDGPHGVREELEWNTWSPAQWTNDSIVAFPSLTCLASTWNKEMATLFGSALSEEMAFRGKDVLLGPGVNIARTPLGGRNFEYMGEDPFLSGSMAVPYIQAVQRNGIACCIKHFALNDQEVDRFKIHVHVDERTLHEIYLAPFKKAVQEAGVWTVMGAYPFWNNVHATQNDSLLNRILKRDWGFKGAVISDWGGTTDTWEAATGGLDLEMGTYTDGKIEESKLWYNEYYMADKLERLVNEGKIPMRLLNDKVSRLLRTIFLTAMNPDKIVGSQCSEAHYAACQQIGEEGIVLLKNNGLLPLDASRYRRILVVGENATRSLTKGGGSSELKTLRDISPLESLKALYGDKIDYAQGYTSGRCIYDQVDMVNPTDSMWLRRQALDKARNADLIIFIGGMNKNTHQDCENGDRLSYDLSFGQNALIADLAKVQRNIVVCMFGGNAYATPWLNQVAGLLQCWYLGSMAGESLTRVLSGEVNPSGKLPVTFAKRLDDYGFAQHMPATYPGIDQHIYYKEGIFVGYRHFDTHHVQPQFPFGFGLSYTTFKYGTPRLSASTLTDGGTLTLTVPVTNTGRREGKEIVQLYLGQKHPAEPRPIKELKGFEKVSLQPGETKTVTFCITPDMLQYFSAQQRQWTTEADIYHAFVCSSETDVRGQAEFKFE